MIAWHQVAIIVPNAFPCRNSPIKFALNTKYVGLNSRFTAKSFWCYPFFRIQGSLDLESSLKKFQAIQIEHAKCHAKMLICPIGTATIFISISYPFIPFMILKRFFLIFAGFTSFQAMADIYPQEPLAIQRILDRVKPIASWENAWISARIWLLVN